MHIKVRPNKHKDTLWSFSLKISHKFDRFLNTWYCLSPENMFYFYIGSIHSITTRSSRSLSYFQLLNRAFTLFYLGLLNNFWNETETLPVRRCDDKSPIFRHSNQNRVIFTAGGYFYITFEKKEKREKKIHWVCEFF